MEGVIFLFVLALIWIVFAVVGDWKNSEIPNWLNFSLIIFALGFRFFYPFFSEAGFSFFYQGLLGLGFFFIMGNLFYYCKIFAGGDAKLMIALGPILPMCNNFFSNLDIFFFFLLAFLFFGAIYGMIFSGYMVFKNFGIFRRGFNNYLKKNKTILKISTTTGFIFIALGLIDFVFIFAGFFILITSLLVASAKSIDERIMVREVQPNKLREGDWLEKSVKCKDKLIKSNWEGLNKEEIMLLKKRNKIVKIKEGLPFAPVFLFSFLFIGYAYFFNEELFSLIGLI